MCYAQPLNQIYNRLFLLILLRDGGNVISETLSAFSEINEKYIILSKWIVILNKYRAQEPHKVEGYREKLY